MKKAFLSVLTLAVLSVSPATANPNLDGATGHIFKFDADKKTFELLKETEYDPKLPRVLIIGDSISMNYFDAAKAELRGIANLHRNEGNAGPSTRGVLNAELWLGNYEEKGRHWYVIQFNHGLHDLKQVYDKKEECQALGKAVADAVRVALTQ